MRGGGRGAECGHGIGQFALGQCGSGGGLVGCRRSIECSSSQGIHLAVGGGFAGCGGRVDGGGCAVSSSSGGVGGGCAGGFAFACGNGGVLCGSGGSCGFCGFGSGLGGGSLGGGLFNFHSGQLRGSGRGAECGYGIGQFAFGQCGGGGGLVGCRRRIECGSSQSIHLTVGGGFAGSGGLVGGLSSGVGGSSSRIGGGDRSRVGRVESGRRCMRQLGGNKSRRRFVTGHSSGGLGCRLLGFHGSQLGRRGR